MVCHLARCLWPMTYVATSRYVLPCTDQQWAYMGCYYTGKPRNGTCKDGLRSLPLSRNEKTIQGLKLKPCVPLLRDKGTSKGTSNLKNNTKLQSTKKPETILEKQNKKRMDRS